MALDVATTRRPTNVKADSTFTITLDSTNSRLLFESATKFEFQASTITAFEPTEEKFLKRIQSDGIVMWYALHPLSKEWVEIDPEQRWFWTEEWQAAEREADEDMKAGRVKSFHSMDDLINDLANNDE